MNRTMYIFKENLYTMYYYGNLAVFVYESGSIYVYRSDFKWTPEYHEKINRFTFDEY